MSALCEEELLSVSEANELYKQAKRYENGEGESRDLSKAAELYVQADINGCDKLEYLYHFEYDSWHKKRTLSETKIEILKKSAEIGYAPAQFSLGARYRSGFGGLEKDKAKAKYWFEQAVERNHVVAMSHLGDMYYKGSGVEKDLAQAFAYYIKASNLGYGPADMILGLMYENGDYVDQDMDKALYYFERSHKNGYIVGTNHLGILYDEGIKVPQDLEKAFYYYSICAEKGFDGGWFGLYSFYYNGRYVEKDVPKAMMYCKQMPPIFDVVADAVKYGADEDQVIEDLERYNALGCVTSYLLGKRYEEGIDVEKDIDRAIKFYKISSTHRYAPAIQKLAKIYERGLGVERDTVKALHYYEFGALINDVGSIRKMYEIYRVGTLAEKDDAVAEKWLSKLPNDQQIILKRKVDSIMKSG